MGRQATSGVSPAKKSKLKLYVFRCLLVLIPLALILVLELLSFTYIKLKSDRGPYRDLVGQVLSPFHPYLGYVHAPNVSFDIRKRLSREMSIATDENGYSVTPLFSGENPELKIILTGGSTMFGVGSSDNASTVPSILERLLNEQLNIRIEVVNLALRGAQSFQEMLMVDRYFAEYQGGLVLAVSGRNDAAHVFSDPTVEGAFLDKHVWENAVSLVHRAERGDFMVINLESKLRSLSHTCDFIFRQLKPFRESDAPIELPKPNLRREALKTITERAKISATHYAAADQISKMNGAHFIMFLQPTLYQKNTWTEEEKQRLTRKKWNDQEIGKRRQNEYAFYEAFRDTEKPFHFVDLSQTFSGSKETLYIDQCHYNDLAAAKLAQKILESIRPVVLDITGR